MQRRGIGAGGPPGTPAGRVRIPSELKDLLERRPLFMRSEEMLLVLRDAGYAFSNFLLAQMKIPNHVVKGAGGMEFFGPDARHRPEGPSAEHDPVHCVNNGLPPPEWLGRWYMAIVPEGEKKSIVFLYRPKGVFAKFPLERADVELPESMRRHTVRRMCDWAPPGR